MLLALLASGPGAGDGGCPPAPGRPLEAQSAAPLREPCILQERLPWSSEAQHTDMAVPPVCLQECQAQVLQGRPGETLTMEEGSRGSSTLGLASQISPCLSARTLSSVCWHSHSGLGNTAPSWQAWPQVWTPAQLFSRLLWHGGEQAEAPRRNFTNQRK